MKKRNCRKTPEEIRQHEAAVKIRKMTDAQISKMIDEIQSEGEKQIQRFMAHIEKWYRCPVCNQAYDNQREAMRCRNQHLIRSELWAIGKGGKGVRILDNWAPDSMHGIKGALRKADLSDDIHERKRQLEELERKERHEPDEN